MQPYTNVIPGTRVAYSMVPIAAGSFMMGSPDSEPGRQRDEGPLHRVSLDAFWMQSCEVTWDQYLEFLEDEWRRFDPRRARTPVTQSEVDRYYDARTEPTELIQSHSFGMGFQGYPAIAMSAQAAGKYCYWLTRKTGHFYRLPTEAEWEYAARAGSTNAYFFGDNPAALRDYAWTADNSDFKYQPVRTKKPNPWGLYDIYGNVFEWCLDQYREEWYSECLRKGLETNVWRRAEEPFPVVVRGGCWDDENVTDFRSARRRASSPAWQLTDPRVSKSLWWLSDARGVGFRIVRPVKVPDPEEMLRYWIIGLKSEPPATGSAK